VKTERVTNWLIESAGAIAERSGNAFILNCRMIGPVSAEPMGNGKLYLVNTIVHGMTGIMINDSRFSQLRKNTMEMGRHAGPWQ
jgi:hypothetical protein